MDAGDRILELQAFIDGRWAVAQPRFYPAAAERPRVHPEVTPREAGYFLASVTANGAEPPLFQVDDERKMRSDRFPPRRDGSPRGYLFFEEPGRLRLETIVHIAAAARLRDEFGWPREHLVFESPDVVDDGGQRLLHHDALDILLLEEPCPRLSSRMSPVATHSRVAVETKATPKLLDRLLREMRACRATSHAEHKKCLALQVIRPQLFLGVAASETWRLCNVTERDGRAVLRDELPDLESLRFSSAASPDPGNVGGRAP